MREPPVIAVSGATGTVGRAVVDELAADPGGHRIRRLTRHPGPTVGTGEVVEDVRFSFTDPDTWPAAFDGVERLFLVRPPELVHVARDLLPAVAAARDAGVRRVVFLSVLGAQRNPLLPHRRVERWLDTSGLAATHLRAGNFLQNLVTVHADDVRLGDQVTVPAGDAVMSYVDARDVAAVAAACLLDRAPVRGAFDLTGPEAIDHHRVASALSDALGRTITYTRPSLPTYWAHARRTGMAPGLVAATSVLYTLARAGIGSRTSPDVATVLGRPARDVDTFARDHASVWAPPPDEGDDGCANNLS
jgi:uncharacterized protein YbjT (DUF2867 family)